MKKITCLVLISILLLPFSMSVSAGTISTNNYKVFQGFSADWGYNNWGIYTYYYGDLTTYSTSKTISKHDILAHTLVANLDYGTGTYFMSGLTVYAESTQLQRYYALGAPNRQYVRLPETEAYYYIFGGIANGTSMSTSKQGTVTTDLGFNAEGWSPTGATWDNTLNINF